MPQTPQRIHFIAIGGSIMHALAICLKDAGHNVTGSDDHFHDPSKSKLKNKGLLPDYEGWNPEMITNDVDFVILGMHAKADNPELLKARELGLKIHSFPEFIYEASKDKQRIVIAGSHGKTTVTSMVMHVLHEIEKDFDYMVGAQLKGFENMVKITDAPLIIIEGDEYTTSPSDSSPKFLHYHHHIGAITGIAWDHYNVYPELEDYTKQFELFVDLTPKQGFLIYCEEDKLTSVLVSKRGQDDFSSVAYKAHEHSIKDGKTYLKADGSEIPVNFFGYHNMQNLSCAQHILNSIGVNNDQFYTAMVSFEGASKRMEVVGKNDNTIIYSDFAHAPSKLRAATSAIRDQFPDRSLVACMELHTFSSLNKGFIDQYENALDDCDEAIIYINPKTVAKKGLESLSESDLRAAFKREDLLLFNEKDELEAHLVNHNWTDKNLIMMSSGDFGGLRMNFLKEKILQ